MDPAEQENPLSGNPRVMGKMERGIAFALLLITAVLTVFFTWGEGLIHRNPPRRSPDPGNMAMPPDPMEPPALTALEAFFEAPDLEAKAEHVRDRNRVLPMMRDYHDRRGHPFPTLGRVSPGQPASFDGTPMVLFEVEPFSGPRYPVAMVWDGHRFVVDWESLTAYGTMDWNEFVETQPTAPHTLRVYIRTAGEAERIPAAPAGSASYSIEHRDDPQVLVALADANLATLLDPLAAGRKAPVTLEMVWKPGGPGGSMIPEIVRLVAPKWSP